MLKTLYPLILFLVLSTSPSYADDVAKCETYFLAENYTKALPHCEKAAEQGDADAQYFLGEMYFLGHGVTKNNETATKWYQKAAEQGDVDAQFTLGWMYADGEGVTQNYKTAAKWFEKAAEQGYAEAQFYLGNMYYSGEGVTQDYKTAAKWYGKAAEQSLAKIHQGLSSNEQPASSSAQSTNHAPQVFDKNWQSVVVIYEGRIQAGSGVIVRPDVVATNCHVLEATDMADIRVYKAVDKTTDKSRFYSATIRHFNSEQDMCLLDVAGLNGRPADMRRAESLIIGEAVFAIGAPEGLDYSISGGIVSRLRLEERDIQTDAFILGGSSGGGLFDGDGNLVGVTTESIEGITFARPAEWVLDVLK